MTGVKRKNRKTCSVHRKEGQWCRSLTNQAQAWCVVRKHGRSSTDHTQDIWKFLLSLAQSRSQK